MLKNIRHITLFFVILIGVLSNIFARAFVHDASKISVKKSVVGTESIKASVELISKQAWRANLNYLTTNGNEIGLKRNEKNNLNSCYKIQQLNILKRKIKTLKTFFDIKKKVK